MAGRRLALIVATDEYRDPGLKKLRAPGTDAQALATVLGDPERGEFEVEVVRNGTSSTIAERVESTLAAGKPEDLIVLHFSCHGLKDDSGELYLAATNTQPSLLASTAVDASFVNRLMRRSRSQRVVLFLDCCYGGAFERGMAPRAAGMVDLSDQFQQRDVDPAGGKGRVVITASNAMEFAFEGTDLADMIAAQPSVFTGALVQGLTTGEADRDQDGMVSLAELYDYIFDRVRAESPNQTPGKWEFGLQGELFLAKNPQRVIVPAPIPPELLELVDHPFSATRQGSIDVLVKLAESTNLPVAAGARETLERLVNDDSRSVSMAAAAAVERTGLRLSTDEIDLGRIDIGATPKAPTVEISGPPLTAASKVEASIPVLHVRRADRSIEITVDTSTPGPIDGIVTVSGPAGQAEVHVVGTVGTATVEPVVAPPASEPVVTAPPEPVAAPPEPVIAAPPPPPIETVPAHATSDQADLAALVGPSAAAATMAPPVAPPPAASAGPPVDAARESPPSAEPARTESGWSWKRAAARAFIGAIIGDLIAIGGIAGITSEKLAENPDLYWNNSVTILLVDAFWFTVIAAALEWFAPSVRIPNGAAYLAARGNALLTSAIQGAVIGLVVGYLDYYAVLQVGPSLDILWVFPISSAIGWVIAEALLARADKPAATKPS
jgi:caspase domain-containing protein